MLRTMINDAPFEQRWIIQGRLCGQWAADLKEKWEETRRAREGRRCVVVVEDVLAVDRSGESTLAQMLTEGASVVTTRAYMKHVLRRLRNGEAESVREGNR